MKNGHEVRFIDADIDNLGHEEIKGILENEKPGLIGITVNIIMVKAAYELAQFLKKHFNTPIVVGGPYPSAVIGKIFEECDKIDFVVFGEGEETTLELVKCLEGFCKFSDVAGLAFRIDGKTHINKWRSYINDLDTIPFPAFELIDNITKYKGTYPVGGHPSLLVFGSRGCPFSCTFCNDSVWRSRNRKRSPENIVREIEVLRDKYKIKELFFQDDTLNLDRKWFEKICDLIIEKELNKEISFKAPLRANRKLVDEALLKKARKAGFWMLFYGVESGDPRILATISKDLQLEEIERAFRLTRKAGIRTLASFMIGNLEEDKESIGKSIDFFKKIDPDYGGFSIATPFPGTAFYNEGLKKGLMQEFDFKTFQFGKAVVNTGYLNPEEVEELQRHIYEKISNYKKSFKRKTTAFFSNVLPEGVKKALWLSLKGEKMFFEGARYPFDKKLKYLKNSK